MGEPTLSVPLLDGRIGRYLAQIQRLPMLDAQQENALAKRFREQNDPEAAQRLVTSHLRLVAKVAFGYRGYGLPISDLISEGNIGLLEAVKRFDPDRGFRFATYAIWWIRAGIQEYALRSWSLVKMGTTTAQKKLFFNLRRLKGRLRVIEEGDLTFETVQLIANELAVPIAEVVSMNQRLSARDHSLNVRLQESETDWQDLLVDESDDQERQLVEREIFERRHALLQRALTQLNTREREIIVARRLREEPIPLAVIADRYGVSPERVRQIEMNVIAKLQKLARPKGSAVASPPPLRFTSDVSLQAKSTKIAA